MRRPASASPTISRAFCIARHGRVFTREEIQSWTHDWKGKSGPALTHCGGYNCRHHWDWLHPDHELPDYEPQSWYSEDGHAMKPGLKRELNAELKRLGIADAPAQQADAPQFVKYKQANSVEEAETLARAAGIRQPSYAGNLAAANYANQALLTLGRRGVDLPRSVKIAPRPFRNEPDAVAAYLAGEDALYLNPGMDWVGMGDVAAEMYRQKYWSTEHESHPLIHEMGHRTFAKANPEKYTRFNSRNFSTTLKEKVETSVSKYAAGNYGDFVAEVYSGLMAGKSYSQFIMKMYNAFIGVKT